MRTFAAGEITRFHGEKIRFKGELMVIATHAVTADDLTKAELGKQDERQERIPTVLCEANSNDTVVALFRPEFIGRVDEISACKKLDQPTALK